MIFRAAIFHTPRNPFRGDGLESFDDGALLVRDGRIAACGDYAPIAAANPAEEVHDLRGGVLIPGLIDTHTHFPQLRIVGSTGRTLLDWLDQCALPEEARMADLSYAREIARDYIDALASHGTTTALVFGAHFPAATACLFEAAAERGLRIASGLVLSDRNLRPELYQTPDEAYRQSTLLIRRFHGQGRLLYAVTPRFALSTSEAMLDVCQTLLRENPSVRFTTHINENRDEIAAVARAFPSDRDYLGVYERFQLTGRRSVLAHNIHATASELQRLAATRTSIAHCPSSNEALASGTFPMQAHLNAGVHFALGTDIGAGRTFSMIEEAHQSARVQPIDLTSAQLLYLATRAGAEALALEDETGDFTIGKSADFVYLQSARDLDSLFSGVPTVRQVRVAGEIVYNG